MPGLARIVVCGLLIVGLLADSIRPARVHALPPASSALEATPPGRQTYAISSSSVSPRFTHAAIDPLDVHPGDTQRMEVKVQDSAPIVSVSAAVETDTGIKTYPLVLVAGTPRDGTWKASWKVRDTHSATYRTTFKAVNKIGDSSSVTLTWTDPCSPPAGGDWTLDGNCSISGVHGVDNGSLILNNAAYTLTILGGATFAWNSGRNITLTAGSTAINDTGQLKQTNLWMTDADADGYPDSATQFAQDAAPANGRRRYLMNSYTTVDLYPASPTTWQNLNCYTDADGDGYTTSDTPVATESGDACPSGQTPSSSGVDCLDSGGGAVNVYQNVASIATDADNDGYYTGATATTCVGSTSVISTRTYYKDTSAAFSKITSAAALGGSDCLDSNAAKWSNRYFDGDGDGYAPNSTLTCVGNDANYYDSRTGYNDCNDSCVTCYPGSTASTASADGLDQDCDGSIDENDGTADKTCSLGGFYVQKGPMQSACDTYCGETRKDLVCNTGTSDQFFGYTSFNFSNCTGAGDANPIDPYCAPDGSATCDCFARVR